MIRKLRLILVIVAVAAAPSPAIARDAHGGRHELQGVVR